MEQKFIHNIDHLDLLARKVVEGYLIGLHKSPFHGFSVEFREHRLFNSGDPIKSIDQKVYARTDRLYVKKYDEETNLKCHFVLDISASMYFPKNESKSKIEFSIVSIASLIQLLKKQRDAFGLATFAESVQDYIAPKLTEKNKQQIYTTFSTLLKTDSHRSQSNIVQSITQLVPQLGSRNMIVIFTDLLDTSMSLDDSYIDQLSRTFQQLLFRKHEIIIFNVHKRSREIDFEYIDRPTEFIDVESGERIKLANIPFADQYRNQMKSKIAQIKSKFNQMGIDWISVDIDEDYKYILETFLYKRKKMY